MAKKSLGSGFSNILQDANLLCDDLDSVFENNLESVKEIEISDISPNPYQPRRHFDEKSIQELANSISNHGLLQPIILIDSDDLCENALKNGEKLDKKTKYFLVAGERRLRAIKLLGETKIKAIIANINSNKTRELALLENIQREDLNPIELAQAYKELMEVKKITQEELASSIQKSRASIANTLRLLTLSEKTQKLIIEGKLSAGHAKVIAGQKADEEILVSTIIGQNLNVRECEKLAKNVKNKIKNNGNFIDESLIDKLKELKINFKISRNKIYFDLEDEVTKDFIINLIKNY